MQPPFNMIDTSSIVVDNFDKQPLDFPEDLLIRFGAKWSSEVINHVPGFRYWEVAAEFKDFRLQTNKVGHIQRAFDFYWACRACVYNGKIGLGIGTTEVIGMATFGTDKFCGVSPDPTRYGPTYGYPHMAVDADERLPFFDGKFAAVFANHVIEHLRDPWASIAEMLRVCESGGYVCLVTPDLAFMRRGSIDPTHTYEFSADQFALELEYFTKEGRLPAHEIVEFNTFDNNFSFNVVLRKQ